MIAHAAETRRPPRHCRASEMQAPLISASLIMAGVAAISALGGVVILARPVTSEQGVYLKRIAATMALAFAVILTLFAWGLTQAGG